MNIKTKLQVKKKDPVITDVILLITPNKDYIIG